jgi:hypothetical protein
VTDDKKQCAALREVVKAAKVDTEVLLYREFIGPILGEK